MDGAVAYLRETMQEIAEKASFQVVDDTDHLTSEDALTLVTLEVRYPTLTAWATLTSAATNAGRGWYEPNGMTTAAKTVGTMLFHLPAAAGYDPVDFAIVIEDEASFKADVSALALEATVAALNDFDAAADTVARVTLVDTTTENTDMVAEAPTVGEIDTELTASHGSGSWQNAASVVGVGPVTVTILDQFAAAVIGAKVTITDVVGSGNYSGGGTTDGDGEVIIDALATGSYTIVSTANGYEIPDTAVTITAVAQAVGITADKSTVNAPVDPTLGTLYGDTVKITGTAAVGVEVVAKKTSADVVYVDSNAVTKYERKTITDVDGRFEFDLLLNLELTITIAQLDYEEDITLTAGTTNLEDAT